MSPNETLPDRSHCIDLLTSNIERTEIQRPLIAPRLVKNDGFIQAWLHEDGTGLKSNAEVFVSLETPSITSARSLVKANLYMNLASTATLPEAPPGGLPLRIADYDGWAWGTAMRGIFFQLSGDMDELPDLVVQHLATIRDLEFDDASFLRAKDRYHMKLVGIMSAAFDIRMRICASWLQDESVYMAENLIVVLQTITADDVRSFKRDLLSQFRIQHLIRGNVCKEDALGLIKSIESVFPRRAPQHSQWPVLRSFSVPPGEYTFRATAKDPATTGVGLFFQFGSQADQTILPKALLLDYIMENPAKEHFGDDVFSGGMHYNTVHGFYLAIRSTQTPEDLESRIEKFLETFEDTLVGMGDSEFEARKPNLSYFKSLMHPHKMVDQIYSGYYDFEFAERAVSLSQQLRKRDMIEFVQKYFNPKSVDRVKLTIYMLAQELTPVNGINTVPDGFWFRST